MYKARIVLILGIWLVILPFLGFPYAWEVTLSGLTGLVLIGASYLLYKDYKATENKEKTFDNFRENDDFNETNPDIQEEVPTPKIEEFIFESEEKI